MTLDMCTMEQLYASQIGEMRLAERRLLEVLPGLREAATTESLRAVLLGEQESARLRLERLDSLAAGISGENGRHWPAMERLIEDVREVIDGEADPRVRDVAIICAIQKIGHYEIAAYGCLRAWARLLGRTEESRLLRETLRDEWDGDDLLSRIAETWVNGQAVDSA